MKTYLVFCLELNIKPDDGFKMPAETPAIAARKYAEFIDGCLIQKPFQRKNIKTVSVVLENGDIISYRISTETVTKYTASYE